MRLLIRLTFCCLISLGVGCAITDYGTIADNDQTRAGNDGPAQVVNTNGKAHINESSQIATLWPDGTDELFSFVDQKSDGTSTITTYNNFSTLPLGNGTFHSDLYCNTEWNGCAIFTAPDDNDGNLFDGTLNPNCPGARSFSIMLSTGRYYGECGRGAARFSLEQKLAALSSSTRTERFARSGLLWHLSPGDTTVLARNEETGQTYLVPLFGASAEHFMSERGNEAATWLDHPMLAAAMTNLTGMLDDELHADSLLLTIEVNGVSASFRVAGGSNALIGDHLRHNAARM